MHGWWTAGDGGVDERGADGAGLGGERARDGRVNGACVDEQCGLLGRLQHTEDAVGAADNRVDVRAAEA